MIIKFNIPGWNYFVSDKVKSEDINIGEWVVPVKNFSESRLDELCTAAIEQGITGCCKHTEGLYELFNGSDNGSLTICFYTSFGDVSAHKRLFRFLIDNGLIEKDGKGFRDINYIMYPQKEKECNLYPPIQKLSDFIELETGKAIK